MRVGVSVLLPFKRALLKLNEETVLADKLLELSKQQTAECAIRPSQRNG